MSGFVMCYGSLLFRSDDLVLPFETSDNPVHCIEKILFVDLCLVLSCSSQGCLVADIRYIRPGEAGRMLGKEFHIEVRRQFQAFEMDLEDFRPFLQVRKFHVYLPVEPSRPQKSLVENICTVRGCKYDDARIGIESVHLGKQLVQGILTFVI